MLAGILGWVTFPKTMLGAGFFHKVFSLIFFPVAFETFPKGGFLGKVAHVAHSEAVVPLP